MSSEEDDLEEEELLQMALKEQAQRNLNYSRPPSKQARPVVNLTAVPSHPSKQRASVNKPQQPVRGPAKQRPAVEEDEESEVELLSISSEDDDDDDLLQDRRASVQFSSVGKRATKDDFSGYVDEPDSWKRVDEAELARRVREMRETRAAPTGLPRAGKGAAFGRMSLSASESLPRGNDLVDPLGLG